MVFDSEMFDVVGIIYVDGLVGLVIILLLGWDVVFVLWVVILLLCWGNK